MRKLILIAGLLAPVAGGAQSAGDWQGPEHVWEASCGFCHGTPVAPDIRQMGLPAAVIAEVVRNGAPGMPPIHPSELNEEELAALIEWIRSASSAQ